MGGGGECRKMGHKCLERMTLKCECLARFGLFMLDMNDATELSNLVSYVSPGWKQAKLFDITVARHDG